MVALMHLAFHTALVSLRMLVFGRAFSDAPPIGINFIDRGVKSLFSIIHFLVNAEELIPEILCHLSLEPDKLLRFLDRLVHLDTPNLHALNVVIAVLASQAHDLMTRERLRAS